jgi:exopolyphosphatase/guanosine-5'-triphosphate,3'-diphosphate pyrophosphatase
MYLAVRYALKNDLPQFWRSNSMILDVGGGSTEIMLLRRGKMVSAHSLKLGTILIDQKVRKGTGSARFIERYINENVRNTQDFLNDEMDMSNIKTLAATGSDVRLAARQIGVDLNEHCRIITRDDFFRFVKSVENYTVEDCVRRLGIPFLDAEGFVPGLLTYRTFMERLAAEELAVPEVSVREGYFLSMARGIDQELHDDFYSQVRASAINLGRKYHFDEAHSIHVKELSLTLFDALEKEHGLGDYERLLLEIAALLHDIGMFIRSSRHQLHGQYIIANSEIFGLKQEDLDIIGNLVRYHRDDLPSPAHIEYIALQREERIMVLKMAAILRVADALDRGHTQRVRNIAVEKREDALIIRSSGSAADDKENSILAESNAIYRDFPLEQMGIKEKADLFQDVFGYKVILT